MIEVRDNCLRTFDYQIPQFVYPNGGNSTNSDATGHNTLDIGVSLAAGAKPALEKGLLAGEKCRCSR